MKRHSSLEKVLAALQEAEAHLQTLRARATAERAEVLRELHVRFGFATRNQLIQALVEFERPRHRGQRSATKATTTDRSMRAHSRKETSGGRLVTRAEARRRSKTGSADASGANPRATDTPAGAQALRARELEQAPAPEPLQLDMVREDMAREDMVREDMARERADQPSVPVPELPPEIQRLFDSAPRPLQWSVPRERHDIVVEILTRGDSAAEKWLWTESSKEEVRALLRRFGGAGCDDETRDLLRQKMGLTEFDIPPRPFRPVNARTRRSAQLH